MLNIVVWLVVGSVVGWLGSMVMKTDNQRGILLNVLVAVVGAVVPGWVVSPLVAAAAVDQGNFSLPSLMLSFVGAVILLALLDLFRRRSVR